MKLSRIVLTIYLCPTSLETMATGTTLNNPDGSEGAPPLRGSAVLRNGGLRV